jgi:hypothetical protein
MAADGEGERGRRDDLGEGDSRRAVSTGVFFRGEERRVSEWSWILIMSFL